MHYVYITPYKHHARRRMTRIERRREAAEARLRVLLGGTSLLYASVARAVSAHDERERGLVRSFKAELYLRVTMALAADERARGSKVPT